MSNSLNEVMTRQEAATYLAICKTTLDRLDIPRIKAGRCVRFKKSDIEKWLTEKAEPKTGGTV